MLLFNAPISSGLQLIYAECVAQRELRTNLSTILVSALEVLNSFTKNGKFCEFRHSDLSLIVVLFLFMLLVYRNHDVVKCHCDLDTQ